MVPTPEAAVIPSVPSTDHAEAWTRLDAVVRRADSAAGPYGLSNAATRCRLLQAIAAELDAQADALQEAARRELGTDSGTVMLERAAIRQQIDALCTVLQRHHWQHAAIETTPLRLCAQHVPLGPTAILGGGATPVHGAIGPDALAALAAGCPVIVHARHTHPMCHALAGQAVLRAVREAGLPDGVYALTPELPGSVDALVAHPDVRAAAAGNRSDALRLMRRSLDRAEPIPVLSEPGACNPVFILPGALNAQAEHLGQRLVRQFAAAPAAHRPALVFALGGDGYVDLRETIIDAVNALAPVVMPEGTHGHAQRTDWLLSAPRVTLLAEGAQPGARGLARPMFAETDDTHLPAPPLLDDACRSPAGLLVRCSSGQAMLDAAARLGRQHAAVIHMTAGDGFDDLALATKLLSRLQRIAGQIGINSTVAPPAWHVAGASFAIERFLRPVVYQDAPPILLPAALQDDNPLHLLRAVDGEMRH
ncbi:aldehyde dehydrogenase (NADP(+)) [Pseudoduganella ginsengisoli]|uniref:Aldehyde dehydrogenase family protein n=1 Tax=Pseudoduganella ginsengisoli TaxID=1462440 RepID=A0A6L6Q026_9BURK|nr:aldehyde dehydrogenase family protein [Pseudoduganella ginsengisoli]MTW02382.1 aldehyde dehydrogenase family protein [Pseudoduganella ginsengisoli]